MNCGQNHYIKTIILEDLSISSVEEMVMCYLNIDSRNHIPILLHPRQGL